MSQFATQSMTARTLANLLRLMGLPTTGTKEVLLTRLHDGLIRPRLKPLTGSGSRPTRILSIDMGIRNLAFCVLDVTKLAELKIEPGPGHIDHPSKKGDVALDLESAFAHTRVVEWRRISLLERIVEAQKLVNGSTTVIEETMTPLVPDPSTFTPAIFSKMTCKLVKEIFLPLEVSHVLIERQRHRSAGSSAVQEWTIRVNMLESMLHAVFEAMRYGTPSSWKDGRNEHTDEILEVSTTEVVIPLTHSVLPHVVAKFWCGPDAFFSGQTSSIASQTKQAKTFGKIDKAQKMIEVAKWLRDPEVMDDTHAGYQPLVFSDVALTTKQAFLSSRNPRARKTAGAAVEKKLDDLADCLLQGVAWAQWDLNGKLLSHRLSQALAGEGRTCISGKDRKSRKSPKAKVTSKKAVGSTASVKRARIQD